MLLALASSRARAHGIVPEAWEPLVQDPSGFSIVRLSSGLAQRKPDGSFEFVCPARWNGSSSHAIAARSDGLIAIATVRGVTVFEGGEFRALPDSAGARGIGAASSGEHLYALLERNGMYEVARVERDRMEVFWRDAGPWHSIGASSSLIQLVALEEQTLRQVLFEPDGSAEERTSARTEGNLITAEARPANNVPFVVLRSASGVAHSASLLVANEVIRPVLMAQNAIFGPAESGPGQGWFAVDGRIVPLISQLGPPPWPAGLFVTRVSCIQGSCFATVRQGLYPIGRGVDAPLAFVLATVTPPDFERVPIARREECRTEWQHWEFDLVAAGIVDPAAPDAGLPGDASAPASDAGASLDAAQSADQAAAKDDEGCSLGGARRNAALPLLMLLLATRSRGRARARSSKPGLTAR